MTNQNEHLKNEIHNLEKHNEAKIKGKSNSYFVKCLGVVLDKKLKFRKHNEKSRNKAIGAPTNFPQPYQQA